MAMHAAAQHSPSATSPARPSSSSAPVKSPTHSSPSTPTVSSAASWASATSPRCSNTPSQNSIAARPSSSPRKPSPATASPSTTSANNSVRSKKMGSMKSILKMLPSVGPFAGMQQAAENVDEGQLNRIETIINSMTAKERRDHESINGSRRKRIARGSGTSVQDVNNLLRQYAQMRKMFKAMGSGGGIKAQQRMMQQMQSRQKFGR